MVVPLAAPHERAGVLSLLYVVSYLGLGVPAVAAGFGVVHGGGLVVTAREYGIAVIALAARGADRPAPPRRRGRAAAARRGGGLHGPGAMISEREGSRQVMATEARTGPALGARAAAGRRQRAVLRGGRAERRHRPRDRAGRRREGVAVQHVRQQGRARAGLPRDPARAHDGADRSRDRAARDAAREAARRVRGQGELFAQPDFHGCAFSARPPARIRATAPSSRPRTPTGLGARAADRAGRPGRRPEPAELARQLHLLYDGAAVTAKMDHDPAAATFARAAAEALLDAALAG